LCALLLPLQPALGQFEQVKNTLRNMQVSHPLVQVPHDDNRLLLRNGLMMAAIAGAAACLGFVTVEAHRILSP
jgi:hypothetical protein